MELRITSRRQSVGDALRELYVYRDLLWILAHREISIRYKQTVIGFLWVVIQPVVTTVLFTLVFGKAAKFSSDGIPYGLFSFAGMTLWGFFANAVTRAGTSVITDERLVTKVYFPRAVIPLAAIASAGVDFAVAFALLLIVACFYGYPPSLTLPAIIPAILIVFAAATGLGTALAGWTVRYRDFRYLVPFVLQIMMYAAPIIYSRSIISPHLRFLLDLNPVTGAIDLFRYGISGHPSLDPQELLLSSTVALLLFVGGGIVFRQVEQSFADNI